MFLRPGEGRTLSRSTGCLVRDCRRCQMRKCAPQCTLSSQPSFYTRGKERDGQDIERGEGFWIIDYGFG